jgi:hypothetical protein
MLQPLIWNQRCPDGFNSRVFLDSALGTASMKGAWIVGDDLKWGSFQSRNGTPRSRPWLWRCHSPNLKVIWRWVHRPIASKPTRNGIFLTRSIWSLTMMRFIIFAEQEISFRPDQWIWILEIQKAGKLATQPLIVLGLSVITSESWLVFMLRSQWVGDISVICRLSQQSL